MIKTAIKRPILISVIFLALLIIGVISLTNLPIELFPNIELPTVSVITVYPGASSKDIEEQITKPIESSLTMVPDIKEIVSKSLESVSTVSVTFDWGKNLDEGVNDLRTQLDFAKLMLPDDAENPMLFKFASSNAPVMVISVSSPDLSPAELSALTERYALDRLRQVTGVGNVFASSSGEKKVNVNLNLPKMKQFNVSLSTVISSIQASNINIPLGEIKEGSFAYSTRVPGEYTSVDQIGRTMVGMSGYKPVYLEEISDITFDSGEMSTISKTMGRTGLVIIVQKQSNANTINVAKGLREKLEGEIKNLYPEGTEIRSIFDTSESIERSVNNLKTTVMYGFIFVIIIVFFFLRNWRGSIIIGMAIPFSLIAAFIYLYFTGSTINIISLASLSIAMGMVVDNSIVVLENIFRHRDKEGEKLEIAAEKGTTQVVTAIMASTLTTIAIFVPLIFIEGFTAVLFKQLAFTVSVVLITSLVTSVTLTPMLSRLLLRNLGQNKSKFENISERWFNAVENAYSRFLTFALNNKKFIIISMILIFILSLGLLKGIKTEFIGSDEATTVFGSVSLTPGFRIEQTDSMIDIFSEKLNKIDGLAMYSLLAGSPSGGGLNTTESNSYSITFIGTLVKQSERTRTDKEIRKEIRKMLMSYPEVKMADFGGGGMMSMMGRGSQISIEIYGEDLDETFRIAKEIETAMETDEWFIDISVSRPDPIQSIAVIPQYEKMNLFGMNNYFLMASLRSGIAGTAASVFRKDGYEYDIFVQFDKKYISSMDDMQSLPVTNPAGMTFPLSSVAKIVKTEEPPVIDRQDQERIIKVEANIEGIALSDANVKVQSILKDVQIPDDVRIMQGGDIKEQQESFRALGIAILLGLILVFLVMAGQFESFVDPFIVMFSIPFAFIGVLWSLFITGTTLSIMGFIGMLMLVGIVVNNAIVLIDYINQLRIKGMSMEEAIPLAGKTRLRPVLMTALTTIFGLLPLALLGGEGSSLWKPLGTVVIGGLTMATVVTLILIPVVYSIVEKRIKRKAAD